MGKSLMGPSAEEGPSVAVFDLGGVLVEWNPRHLYRKIFADDVERMEWFLTHVCSATWNLMQDAGRSFDEAVAELTARFPEQGDLIAAYHQRWEEMVPFIFDDVAAVLEDIKSVGSPVYCITNFSSEKFDLVRRKYAFFDLFDGIVVSGKVRLVKPDPGIFLHFLEKFGLRAADCVFIDDSAINIDAASALGFHTVHHRTAGQLREKLVSLGLPLRDPASTAA